MMAAMRPIALLLLALALALLPACGTPAAGVDAAPAAADTGSAADAARPLLDAAGTDGLDAAVVLLDAAAAGPDAAAPLPDAGPRVVTVRLFHTSDEHGWLEPATESGYVQGGAANLRGWLATEGFSTDEDVLLSSGDNWQGPAISGYFQGEPTVAAMNLVGYSATAIGNHEFDFGRDAMKARFAQSAYAELAANIRVASTGAAVDFAAPYALLDVQGVKLGVIGLTTPTTATETNPKLVSDLVFDDPLQTLEKVVPQVRSAGADAVVVLAHVGAVEMAALADALEAKVEVVFTGHDHAAHHSTHAGAVLVGSGWAMRGYSVTTLKIDTGARTATVLGTRQVDVRYASGQANPVTPDAPVAALVASWKAKLDAALGETIGYTASGFGWFTWKEANWTSDAWLAAFPEADVVVQNFGGLRQAVPSGPITKATVFGLLPFDNRIVGVKITGAQLLENLQYATGTFVLGQGGYPAVAGMSWTGAGSSVQIKLASGAAFDPAATYTVLTNDYLYAGGNGYLFGSQDPDGVDMGVSYRDPVVAWTQAQNTTAQDPLENHVDAAPRDQ